MKGRVRMEPPPGKKFVRDWNGLTVRTKIEMGNGYGIIPAGTTCKVEYAGGGMGMQLRTERCACCGIQFFISRVLPMHVDIVEKAT